MHGFDPLFQFDDIFSDSAVVHSHGFLFHAVDIGKAQIEEVVDTLRSCAHDKAADGGIAPCAFVMEHVFGYEVRNRSDGFCRKAKAREDFFRHFGAYPLVVVKRYRFDAVFSEYALGFRLSDIVEEGCKAHDEIVFRCAVAGVKEVIEHVEVVKAPRVGLETAASFEEFGDKEGEYARFFEHFQRDRGFVGSQHFDEFIAKAFDRNFLDDGERFGLENV